MITCQKCNKELEDGTKFCPECGAEVYEKIFCQNCGMETSTEFTFCQNCGASITEDAIKSEKKQEKKMKKGKLYAAVGVGAVAVLLILLLSMLFGKENQDEIAALYLKDGEIIYTGLEKLEPMQITTALWEGASTEDLMYDGGLAEATKISSDGTKIFFPDKMTTGNEGYALYYRILAAKEAESIKIDSDVTYYSINEEANLITYLKGEDGILYQHNLDEKVKIDSDVEDYWVSDDGSKLIYINTDGNIYIKRDGVEAEKIDSESEMEHVSEDLTVIYYLKDGSLYKKAEGAEKEKIDSDVHCVNEVYETGEIYYTKYESEEVSYMEYIEDDLAETDLVMTEPEYPDYPYRWDYDSTEEYEAVYAEYEEACEAYEEAYYAYLDKEARDSLRVQLRESYITKAIISLYYYNGEEAVEVTDKLSTEWFAHATEKAVAAIECYSQVEIEKLKLSEITDAYEVSSMLEAAFWSATERYAVVADKMSVIEQTEAEWAVVNSSGNTIYYLDDVNEESNHGDLYKVSIVEGEVQPSELYDSDVLDGGSGFISSDKFSYFKDWNSESYKGELYVNKEKIDYDVRPYSLNYNEEQDNIYYFTDYHDEKLYGTLKCYKDEEAKTIADDVHSFLLLENEQLLYLYDYSVDRMKGDLYLYNGGEEKIKVDDDVAYIFGAY